MKKKKNQLEYVKTCVTLPRRLWRNLRIYAIDRDMTQSEVVTTILMLGLGPDEKKGGK
jgi:predicted DNA-binding ribbon-helix-helix protein